MANQWAAGGRDRQFEPVGRERERMWSALATLTPDKNILSRAGPGARQWAAMGTTPCAEG